MSGSLGSTSLSDLTLEPLFHSFLSWSVVRQSIARSLFVDDGDAVVGDLDLACT